MSSPSPPSAFKFGKREKAYNEGERTVMDVYKAQYMQTTTPAERKELAQGFIFPALFSHWAGLGIDLNPTEKNKRVEVSILSFTNI
jgi:hypothetical protein